MRSTFSKFVVCLLALAACSPAAAVDTTTTSTTSTTSTTLATTTTSVGNNHHGSDDRVADQRVAGFRSRPAQPQAAGGEDRQPPQRQAAVRDQSCRRRLRDPGRRHLQVPDSVDAVRRRVPGPDALGRPTDSTLLTALNQPTFAISGAQGWVQEMIRSKDINLLTETTPPHSACRSGGRHTTSTPRLRVCGQDADARGYQDLPPTGPIWEFGPMPTDADPASAVHIDFRGHRRRLGLGRRRPGPGSAAPTAGNRSGVMKMTPRAGSASRC